MKVHIFQHVEFESEGRFVELIGEACSVTRTEFYHKNFTIPQHSEYDLLLVLGGPMGVYETDHYPWIDRGVEFIKEAIDHNKKVFGICLGSQLIARALGSKVYKGNNIEIGWFDITKSESHRITSALPETFTVLHWHGDTFDLPMGATRLFESNATKNQGFVYSDNVLALQFHLEMGEEHLNKIIENCADDLKPDVYVQTANQILNSKNLLISGNEYLHLLLKGFLAI